MAQYIGKMAANKLLRGEAKKYMDKKVAGEDDPYFMIIQDPKTGKKKKVRKVVPEYIPDKDAEILAKVRRRAYKLDMALFNFAGTRFGWSSIIGIVPGFGDVGDVLLSLLLFLQCNKVECHLTTANQIEMLINIGIDFIIGLIPFVGDFFDGYWKANTRNVRVLEKRLDEVYKSGPKEEKIIWGDSNKHRRPPPATVWEDFDDEDAERREFIREQKAQESMQRPQPAATRNATRDGRGGWFSQSRGTRREPDVEMAQAPSVQESGTVYNERR